jgi:hypothetical protein
VRHALVEVLTSRRHTWECGRLVFEGVGLKNGIKRTVLAGLLLMARGSHEFTVHDTLEAALASLQGIVPVDIPGALRFAREQELLR